MARKSFRSDLNRARPDIAEATRGHEMKRKLALALRALRKEKGLTQKDIEARSDLTQPMISRLEQPTGALPNWDTVTRYVEACGGHMLISFSGAKVDETAFLDAQPPRAETVAAIAV
ncbi:Helix-turn-helix domain protein [Roseivivax sp. THAF40]|uniref:helix-turn-helix domain-containing protein n=1 Tax=unclassified Roseivivax TaxID=2639302 RepID=UPI0012689E6D|nr:MULTISPECIES: helix-turn-helix transcriptional regulator [unclassified Roseivivax]QFS83451.1 Helix-turn-helix domain protein [Roseivivax sp. THAF197b]QFT47196.1 Helix-turn-helix domain protein [Roseivivax sp. THAF40]